MSSHDILCLFVMLTTTGALAAAICGGCWRSPVPWWGGAGTLPAAPTADGTKPRRSGARAPPRIKAPQRGAGGPPRGRKPGREAARPARLTTDKGRTNDAGACGQRGEPARAHDGQKSKAAALRRLAGALLFLAGACYAAGGNWPPGFRAAPKGDSPAARSRPGKGRERISGRPAGAALGGKPPHAACCRCATTTPGFDCAAYRKVRTRSGRTMSGPRCRQTPARVVPASGGGSARE